MMLNNNLKKGHKYIRCLATLCCFLLFCTTCSLLYAQEGPTDSLQLADIPGYVTLKCDFHMHTVFSDGHVWPSFRVYEAQRDGLDAISMTEHIDYEGYPEEVKHDANRSYEIGKARAAGSKLMVIKGVEISPRVPPYHCNALFVKDANKIPYAYMKETHKKFIMKDSITKEELMAPFLEVQRQGAFVFYNHPGYAWWDKKDRNIFTTFHKELLEKGILGGVEVVNSGRYNVIAHELAMRYNLTMLGNSDEHYDIANRYQGRRRPMTLVFAKHRDEESIKEALIARRTAVLMNDILIGRKALMEPFFKKAVSFHSTFKLRNGEPIVEIALQNMSDIPFRLKLTSAYQVEDFPLGRLRLEGREQKTVVLKAVWEEAQSIDLSVNVENIITGVNEELQLQIPLSFNR